MRHITVLTLSTDRNDGVYEYVDAETAQRAVDAFGAALSVNKVVDGQGERWLVECESQRGPCGAFAMHAIACEYRIPVHVR